MGIIKETTFTRKNSTKYHFSEFWAQIVLVLRVGTEWVPFWAQCCYILAVFYLRRSKKVIFWGIAGFPFPPSTFGTQKPV